MSTVIEPVPPAQVGRDLITNYHWQDNSTVIIFFRTYFDMYMLHVLQAQVRKHVLSVQMDTYLRTGGVCRRAALALTCQSKPQTTDRCRGPVRSESAHLQTHGTAVWFI